MKKNISIYLFLIFTIVCLGVCYGMYNQFSNIINQIVLDKFYSLENGVIMIKNILYMTIFNLVFMAIFYLISSTIIENKFSSNSPSPA